MIKIGEIRYNLKLLEIIPNIIQDRAQIRCECLLCGSIKTMKRNKFGYTKSCGCLKLLRGEKNHRFTGYKEIHGAKWKTYIRNAKKRNIIFDITIEYAWDIFEKQNKKCSLSGVDLTFWKSAHIRQATASLDRIDNTKGYIKGNIHWVHKKINQIKMDMNTEDFKEWCAKVVETTKNPLI